MVEIGDAYRFIPTAYLNGGENRRFWPDDSITKQQIITGTVTMINWEHRWFRVAYQTDFCGTQFECFKF